MRLVFANQPLLFVILVVLFFIWLAFLTVLFFRLNRHYQRLANFSSGSLDKVLEKVMAEIDTGKNQTNIIKEELKKLSKRQDLSLSRLGMVRFNPFGEVGGRQSFSLAVLDSSNSGLVLTVFHNRDATRVYAKIIKDGQSQADLSKEEKLAIKKSNEKNKVISN